MSLLKALGLQVPAAGLLLGGRESADADEPSPPAGTGAKAESAGKPKPQRFAAPLEELAKWPSKAHRAWKRLDHVQQSAVAAQMASRYGVAFAKDFLAAAASGKTKLEGADFVTALPSQTPDAMTARGFRLAQRASTADRAQEWWVRADGYEVFLLRELKPGSPTSNPGVQPAQKKDEKRPPVEPPGKCDPGSLEQLKMALEWASDALAEAVQAHKEIEAEKARMDKLNVTSKDFEQAYDALGQRLKDQLDHLEQTIETLRTTKEALADSGCDLSKLDTSIDDLGEEVTAFEVEKGLHEMDIRKPIKVDVKEMPGGPDDE